LPSEITYSDGPIIIHFNTSADLSWSATNSPTSCTASEGWSGSKLVPPVAYYPFEGNANDASGNGNNGTVYGATLTTDGKIGQGYSFDGENDYIDVGGTNFNPQGPLTVSVWAKPNLWCGLGYNPLVTKGGSFSLERVPPAGMGFYIKDGTSWKNAKSAADIPLDSWTHVVGVYDGSNISIYINGVKSGASTPSGNPVSDISNILIGHNSAGTDCGRYWKGSIDEVKIWNYALTSSDILNEFSNYGSESTGNLTTSKTYTLTCTNDAGISAPDSVTVNVNQKPTVVANVFLSDPCDKSGYQGTVQTSEGKITMPWTYKDIEGDVQNDYQIQLDDDSNFTSIDRDCTFNNNLAHEAIARTKLSPFTSTCPDIYIEYGKKYYWRVRVKAGSGNTDWSNWSNATIPAESFTTPSQPYPYVDFSCSPTSVTKKRDVTFIDASKCYSGGGMVPCNSIEDDQIIYTWNFGADVRPDYCSPINAKIPPITCQYDFVANEARNEIIQLTISDNGNSCPSSVRMVQVSGNPFRPPTWIEIAPF
ncbi:MAG: LamG domain-containing protein, partial [Candidatus Nealsonbacteria bacterium]|nr:LamG domain-containing protein [Candidatus Nealsonbacteria bacterium]